MVSFETKKIDSDLHMGQVLKQARIDIGDGVEKIGRRLNINKRYIEALENGYYWLLPELAYTKKYLQTYASHLGLNAELIERVFLKEWDIYQKSYNRRGVLENEHPLLRNQRLSALVIPKVLKYSAISLVLLVCVLYIAAQVQNIFIPPRLSISAPSDNFVTDKPVAAIVGETIKEASLTINGKAVLIDDNGYFHEEVPIQKGMNILKISAVKEYSQPNIVWRKVMMVDEEVRVKEADFSVIPALK
ncbi:MAG: helix-turn-helix domain-containing protein [Parcubacteria group bacterium]|nr:helix-turn-helix domain-containing protein [Parcubacteria group bacterium]